MRAKDYLLQIEKLDAMITNKTVEREGWKEIALSVTATSASVVIHKNGNKELHNMEKVQASGSQSKMADAVIRYVDIETEINRLIDKLINLKQEIIRTIEQLNATEYDVLHRRYIQGMTFDEIGAARRKSKSWATTVHGRALKNVQRILNERDQADNNAPEV